MIISFFHLIRGRDRAGYFGTKYGKAKGRLCPWGLRGIKQASSEAATGPGILEQNTERRKGAYAPGGYGG